LPDLASTQYVKISINNPTVLVQRDRILVSTVSLQYTNSHCKRNAEASSFDKELNSRAGSRMRHGLIVSRGEGVFQRVSVCGRDVLNPLDLLVGHSNPQFAIVGQFDDEESRFQVRGTPYLIIVLRLFCRCC